MTADAWAAPGPGTLRHGGSLAEAVRALFAALKGQAAERPRPAESIAIRLLRRRDPDAWHTLFTTELQPIYRYVRARVGNATDAEDLTGRVFEEAWKHAESIEDRGLPARAWLFGIARHVVASHRRRWVRKPPHLSIDAFEPPADGTGTATDLLDLARAIGRLPSQQAEVITLRFVHGLSLQETAEAIGASVDAVKGRQARALAELRRMLSVEESAAGGR
ncbi:MAG: hypothetical protein Kow0010_02400 [Dehalococcoidia bacterium]